MLDSSTGKMKYQILFDVLPSELQQSRKYISCDAFNEAMYSGFFNISPLKPAMRFMLPPLSCDPIEYSSTRVFDRVAAEEVTYSPSYISKL